MKKNSLKLNTKIIFVIGGIFSGLGKGVLSCAIANLIKANQLKVSMQKHDPYLNVDSGFMNPSEHGEVFVTDDGLETDLDLGNYERFLNQKMTKYSSVTAGKIYQEILSQERANKFNGKTINIYNIAEKIQEKIFEIIAFEKSDCLIVELGGTVGDNDLTPFLIAVAQMQKLFQENICIIFLTYISFLQHLKEFKTKPAQNSFFLLRTFGIEPNFIFLRSNKKIPEKISNKFAKFTYFDPKNVFTLPDVDIYQVPILLKKNDFLNKLFFYFNLKINLQHQTWENWLNKINKLNQSNKKIKIAIVNKYPNFEQSYLSLFYALKNASVHTNINFEYQEINPQLLNKTNINDFLAPFDAIIVPGGFGERGSHGKMLAIEYARNYKIPFFGICFGMQLALIEYAKNKLNIKNATSEEFIKKGDQASLIIVFDDQKEKKMIIGSKQIAISKNTLTFDILKEQQILRRHRHRFIFNPKYYDLFLKSEMIFSGKKNNNSSNFVLEIIELKNHPFFIGTQFHEELTVYPEKQSLLFNHFFLISLKNKKNN